MDEISIYISVMISVIHAVHSVVRDYVFVVKMRKSGAFQEFLHFRSVISSERVRVTCQHEKRAADVVTDNRVMVLPGLAIGRRSELEHPV